MNAPEDSHFVARFARWSHRIVASPFAPVVTLLLILISLFVLPPLGLDGDRVRDVELFIATATLLLVFLLEHNEERDTAAIHVKLDQLLMALGEGEDKVGVEELPMAKIERVREKERRKAAR
jgi:low affinity Fe/Cu permease